MFGEELRSFVLEVQVPSFQPFNESWGDIFHRERRKFVKSIPLLTMAGFWGMVGPGVRRNSADTFLRWRAAPSLTSQDISPEKTFIWAQSSSYVILLTRTPICLSYELLVSSDRQRFTSALHVGQIALDHATCSR